MPAIFKTVYFPLRCFFSSFLLNPFALSTSTIHKKRHKQKYKNNLVSLNCPNCVDYFLLWFLRVCILLYHPLVCRILKKKKKTLYIFGQSHSIWKFLGQGSKPRHSNNPSYSSDNAGSLTCCAIREVQKNSIS